MQTLTTSSESDEQYLRRAIELTQKSFGLASPNPNVGALLVDSNDEVLGEGFHTY
ncbi:MAG: bifunctional diaminohydroxyphosphoribosylaminopyrimidine deaminase/5-amino-6-(5-phosphoribosylamino)uracil reductase RibD, partial [Terriglobales bacterium]